MSLTVIAQGGKALPIGDLAMAISYVTISGTAYPQTFTVVYQGVTYVKTYTYTDTNLTNISQWIPQ